MWTSISTGTSTGTPSETSTGTATLPGQVLARRRSGSRIRADFAVVVRLVPQLQPVTHKTEAGVPEVPEHRPPVQRHDLPRQIPVHARQAALPVHEPLQIGALQETGPRHPRWETDRVPPQASRRTGRVPLQIVRRQ